MHVSGFHCSNHYELFSYVCCYMLNCWQLLLTEISAWERAKDLRDLGGKINTKCVFHSALMLMALVLWKLRGT